MAGRNARFGFWEVAGRLTGSRDDLGQVDFATLTRRSSPNDALICPDGVCPFAGTDAEPPVFAMSTAELLSRLFGLADAELRMETLYVAPGATRARFVQRSRLMRFPDVVDAMVLPRGEGQSTIALYSRSVVGYSDLGVNRARLLRMLAALGE